MSEIAGAAGQLVWVGFDGLAVPAELAGRIGRGDVGAVVLFRRNVDSPAQVQALCSELHALAPADRPLLIAIDQEGGRVQRLRAPATEWPPMLRLGERAAGQGDGGAGAVALASAVGRALGDELAAVGVDVNFAPVLDVHTNPQNPVIGDRAFATTPEQVTAVAGAFARGLAAAGVLGCGKHFPGHGDTAADSHLALPRLEHGLERLRAVELVPFRALPELPLCMTAHVVFAALDAQVPATLSPALLTGLLRRELGYQGVVVSDDLEMRAIVDHFGLGDSAVRGLVAGCDAFLVCHRRDRQEEARLALVAAAARDGAVRLRLGEAAARVAALKAAHAATWRGRARPPLTVLGSAAHLRLAAAMGEVTRQVDPTE
jgi:beta-N-acetylhexosaminidase